MHIGRRERRTRPGPGGIAPSAPGRVRVGTGLLAAAALLAGALTGCSGADHRTLLRSIENGTVLIGTTYDQPGMGLRGPDGAMTGFDVDVAKYVVNRIAEDRRWKPPKINWRDTPFNQRVALLTGGEVDAVVAGFSITADRAAAVGFAGPYLVTRQGMMVRADDPRTTVLADLGRGRTLCSASGTTSAAAVKQQLPTVQVAEFDSYSACVDALRKGWVDALTTDETILVGFARRYRDVRVVDMNTPADKCVDGVLHRAGTPLSIERYGIGLGKDDTESVAAVNGALRQMIDSGAWERALRADLGPSEADWMLARTDFLPHAGDLGFLTAPGTKCDAR